MSAPPMRDAAKDVLDALCAAEDAAGQQVGVQAAVRRLVDVVREEEREDHQRGRPEARHEREQREAKPIGPSAASMNGRRRPSGVWNVSLHGPITSGSVSAKKPSAASTSPTRVVESV